MNSEGLITRKLLEVRHTLLKTLNLGIGFTGPDVPFPDEEDREPDPSICTHTSDLCPTYGISLKATAFLK